MPIKMKGDTRTREVSLVVLENVNDFFKLRNKGKEDGDGGIFSPRLRQFYITLGIVLITISLGMVEGFSAILLPQLEKEGKMVIDEDMSSWIASISALPTPLGCALGGWLMEAIGRKTIHLLTCIPCLVGWILIYFSTTTTPLLIGRFTSGICLGILGPPSGVYAAETSDPNFRGFLLAAISLAITSGIALSHIVGSFATWQNTALVACVFPVACLIITSFAPESPTFLVKKSKMDEAIKAFHWCRGRGRQAEEELRELIARQTALTNAPKKTLSGYLKNLKKREFLKPLAILMVFFFTNQWCGNNAMTFYNVDIIKQTLGGSFDEYTAMIMMDVVRVTLSILACYLLQRVKRRALALVSCIGTITSLFTLSAFTFSSKYYPGLASYPAIPLTALISYMSFITIGIIPLPWAMLGELFPLAYRGTGTGLSALVNYAFIFSVVKTAPWLFFNLGTDGTFLLYGLVCATGTAVLAVFLPETKGKPLHEIEDGMKG